MFFVPKLFSLLLQKKIKQTNIIHLMNQGVPIRAYTPSHQGPLFDDDPGIMSEVETASTGFRRGGKQRSSLPVVRTPSKTLERPLGNDFNGIQTIVTPCTLNVISFCLLSFFKT